MCLNLNNHTTISSEEAYPTSDQITNNILSPIRHWTSIIQQPTTNIDTFIGFVESDMPQSSGLTASGLLYEGNFDEWLSRMHAVLAQHGCSIRTNASGLLGVSRNSCSETAKEVASILWYNASPNFRLRVPEKHRESPTALIRALRKLARPFRLMDLPRAVWSSICLKSIITSHESEEIRLLKRTRDIGTPNKFEDTNQVIFEAPLLAVNRLIRLEFLSIYYLKTYDLVFTERYYSCYYSKTAVRSIAQHPELYPRPTNPERVAAINVWVSRSKPDSLTYLRNISIQLPLFAVCELPRDGMLHIRLKPGDDWYELAVEEHAWLTPNSQRLLLDHAAAISKLARSLKLQGQALIMFLTSRPDMWDQLELAEDRW
jgi:hypothetical protein